MRIAIYHNLPSGGAKRSLYETVRRLNTKHHFDLYTLSTADEEFCNLRPLVHKYQVVTFNPLRLFSSPMGRLNQLQRWRDLRRLDQLSQQIAQKIDLQHYDVVFAQPCMWTQAPLIIRHLQTPTLYYCHEPPRAFYESEHVTGRDRISWRDVVDRVDPLIPLYRSTGRRLEWEATRSARKVLVNSKFIRDTASNIYGFSPQVCYHGVDTTCFRPLPHVDRQEYVLSVGAIIPTKGFDFLIRSIGCLTKNNRPPLKLVGNVGNKCERQRLEQLAQEYMVDLSIEIGIDEETLVRRYNQAALLVYAPHNEPFGLVPLEAMACGTPVVGVDEGGVRETVVDSVTGRLVRRNAEEFAVAIDGLLSDKGLRSSLGKQALDYVLENWNWDKAVARIEQHLYDIAKKDCAQ